MRTVAAFTSPPLATLVTFDEHSFTLHLADGRTLSVPYAWSPRLAFATQEQRVNYKLLGRGTGIHWPEVDEDLSVEGLLLGLPIVGARTPKAS